MHNGLSKSFDESRDLSGILALINEPSRSAFFQQCLRSLLNLFQYAAKTVGGDMRGKKLTGVPGQLRASPCLLRVSVGRCRGDVPFEPLQLGLEAIGLLLDISEFLWYRPYQLWATVGIRSTRTS